MTKGIKYLLYSDVGTVVRFKADGRGMHPAVMLYFNTNRWNRQVGVWLRLGTHTHTHTHTQYQLHLLTRVCICTLF